jgi:hypothetical protein
MRHTELPEISGSLESGMLKAPQCVLLSLMLTVMPAWGAPGGDQPAGEVKALIPDASRNAQPVAVKDALQWNDLLKTNAKGRLRAGLTDGSILSLGSNSELKVVQHDAKSQQTVIEMNYGKLRNQVVKITQPGGKYEVKTPNAVIGVIGTDFYVAYDNNQTTVICYQGQLVVTPTAAATVTNDNNASTGAIAGVTVTAGQMVVVGAKDQISGLQTTAAAPLVLQTSIRDTEVSERRNTAAWSSHRTKIIVITAMVVTTGLTVALTQINSSSKPCGCK